MINQKINFASEIRKNFNIKHVNGSLFMGHTLVVAARCIVVKAYHTTKKQTSTLL